MPLPRFARALAAITFLAAALGIAASAQTAAPLSWTSTISTGLAGPSNPNSLQAIAVAPNGDIYGATGSSYVLKYPVGGAAPVQISTGNGTNVTGVAVDPAGNVYLAVNNLGNGVAVIPAGSSTAQAVSLTWGGTGWLAPSPTAISVAGGFVYVADPNGGVSNGAGGSYGLIYRFPVGTGASTATLVWEPSTSGSNLYSSVAADAAGNVYVAATYPQTNEVGYIAYSGSAYATSVTDIGTSGNWSEPGQIALDASGNLYVTNNQESGYNGAFSSLEKVTSPLSSPAITTVASGSPFYTGVAFDSLGNLYWETDRGSGSGTDLITELASGGVNFRGQAVGAPSSTIPVTFNITASGTFGTPLILTQGNASGDFADAGSSTCSGSLTSGNTCVVNVKFTPAAPGARLGAVVLIDGSSHRLATAYLMGTGVGPASTFATVPPTVTDLATLGDALGTGVAVDTAGHIYYGDNSAAAAAGGVDKVGGSNVSYGQGGHVGQIAVDGAGNIFFPDGNFVWRYDAGTAAVAATQLTSTGTLSGPQGLAVDGAGNLYIADTGDNKVIEVLAAHIADADATSLVTLRSSGVASPYALALDGQGDLFIDLAGTAGTVAEYNLGTTAFTAAYATVTGGTNNTGLALDSSGSLYVADSGKGVVQFPPTGGGVFTTLTAASTNAYSVAVDAAGNVYYVDNGAQKVEELPLATPPTLPTFGSVALGNASASQSIVFSNVGNSNLTLTALAISQYFTITSSGGTACTSTTSLVMATNCLVTATFNPNNPFGASAYSGQINFTDNAGNVPGTVQSVNLSGIGTQTATKLAMSAIPANLAIGANLGTVTVTLEDANSLAVQSDSISQVTVTITGPSSFSQASAATTLASGVAGVDLSGIALPAAGAYTATATISPAGTITQATASATVVAPSLALANTAVGANIASTPVTVLIATSGSTGAFGIGVLTSGQPSLDFTNATGGNCAVSTPYTAGQTCTVNVKFQPTAPGLRQGAVVLYDASGTPLGTTYLSGTGNGAVAAFPGVAATFATSTTGDNGLATDGVNLYTGSNFTPAAITKINSSGVNSVVSTNAAAIDAQAFAVDGAGNLFVVAGGNPNQTIQEFVNNNGTLNATPVTRVSGLNLFGTFSDMLAVDGGGNLILSQSTLSTSSVVEYAVGSTTPVTLSTLPTNAYAGGLALDPAGNIYVNGNGTLYKVPAGGGAAVAVNGIAAGDAMAFDAAGDLYVGPTGTSNIVQYSNLSTTPTVVNTYTADSQPNRVSGIVLDGAGNLIYAEDIGFNINKITVRNPPAFTFPSTAVTQHSAPIATTLANLGNAPLTVSSVTLADTIHFANTGACLTASPLAPAATCSISVVFTPDSATTFNTTDTITDTDFAVTTPVIAISTAAATTTTTTITLPAPTSPTYGTAVTTIATVVTPGSGSPAFSAPTGTLSGYVDAPGTDAFSGLALASGAATVNVGILHNGSHTLYVTYSGDGTYSAITTPQTVTFTVAKVTLTPSLTGTFSRVYDATTAAAITQSNFALAGLVNSDTVSSLGLTYTGATFDTKDVATGKTITATGVAIANGNFADYTLASTTASGPIGAITQYNGLSITADNKTFAFGGSALPAYTYTITGFLSGDTAGNSTNGGTVTLSSTALTTSPVGNYAITPALGTLTSTDYAINLVPGTLQVDQYSQAFTAVATVAGSTSSATITFNPAVGGETVGSVGVVNLTGGSDFAITGGTCAPGTIGSTCTVTLSFTPSAPGLRRGAVVLFDNSSPGVPLQTVQLSGIGTGPAIAFPLVQSVLSPRVPGALGIDSDGTYLYVAGVNGIARFKISDGTYTASFLTGIDSGAHLKLDGAGNIFVADPTRVQEFVKQGDGSYASTPVTLPALGALRDLAIDAIGDVFGITSDRNTVNEYPAGGGAAITIATGGGGNFNGLAFDQAGNFYYSLSGTPQKVAAAALNGTANPAATPLTGITATYNFGFDAAGDLYAGSGTKVVEYANSAGTLSTSAVALATVGGDDFFDLYVDPAGGVFAADNNTGAILALNPTAPAFTFSATQPDGVTATLPPVALTNIGNQTLNFSAFSVADTTNYALTGSTCSASATVATGGNCLAGLAFTPTTAAAHNTTLDFTTDAAVAAQHLTVTGTSLATTLAAASGSGQSTHISTAFTNPLVVNVTSNGAALQGVVVTFSGPGGATVTATSDASGTATATFTANATPTLGYTVTAAAPDATSVTFTLTNVGNADHLAINGMVSPSVAGVQHSFFVQALDVNNQLDTTNADTIAITSSDSQAALPANAALVNGSGVFNITLKTASSATITATDTNNLAGPVAAGSATGIFVNAAAATHLAFIGPGNANKGTTFMLNVRALDPYQNLDTNYAGIVTLSSATDAAATFGPPNTLSNGAGNFAVTFNTGGLQTVTATDNSTPTPFTATTPSIGVFPISSAVNTPVTSIPVQITFFAPGTVATISVLTQGNANGDFKASTSQPGSGACAAGPYSAFQSCMVNVDFNPTAPGLRMGAVVLSDSSHKPLATAYISGLGQGPAVAFTGGAKTVIDGTDFSGPRSLAIDGGGNYYVADSTKNQIYLVAAGTGIGTAIAYPPAHNIQGIALDGAGNLYVAQNSGSTSTATAELVKIPLENGVLNPADSTTIGTYAPTAVAADAQGNVYIFDAATLNIYQIKPAGGPVTVANASLASGHFSDSLTVGPDGAIYFIAAGEEFSKYAPVTFSHSYITNFAGEGVLSGAAVDAAGDIFVTTTGSGSLIEMAPNTTQTTLASSSNSIRAVALDPAGNAYILDSGSGLNKVDLADAPTLAFPNTTVNPTSPATASTTVSNVGNQDLVLAGVVAAPSEFGNTSTCASQTLGASTGTTCTLSANFAPGSATSFNGTLTLSDNAFNGTSQALPLTGTGILATPTITLTPNPSATPTYGVDDTVGVVVTGLSNIPASAALTYTLDGVSGPGFGLTSGAQTLNLGVLAAGTHTVVVTYTADTTYATAASPTLTFTVAKAVLAFAPLAHTASYGTNFNATAAFATPTLNTDYSVSGYVNSDTSAAFTGAPVLSTTATATTPVVTGGTITIAPGTLAAANYTFDTTATAALTISKAPLTVALTAQSLPYGTDFTASPFTTGVLGANFTVTGFVNSETTSVISGGLTLAANATSTSTVAGSPYSITEASNTLSAANYSFSTPASAVLTITKAVLAIVPAAQSLPYGTDFNSNQNLAIPVIPTGYSLTGFKNSEDATSAGVSGSPVLATTADNHTSVATGGTITATAGTLSAANYSFTPGTPGTLTITPLTLTASLVAPLTKVYDGSSSLTLAQANYALAGVINGDTVALASYPTPGTFTDGTNPTSQVLAATTVTVSGLSLTNNPGNNYVLAPTSAQGSGTITPRSTTVSITGTPTMVYNGTTASTNILSATNYSFSNLVLADTGNVSLQSTPLSGTYNDATVAGATTITVTGLALNTTGVSSNYSLSSATATGPATITAATITPSLTGAVTKIYDSTTSVANLTSANYAFTGAASGDDATAIAITTPAAGTYDNATVGTGKTVTVSGISLTGTKAANYVIANTGAASAAIGAITYRDITPSLIGAATKVYDGGVAATLTAGNYTFSGKQGSDDVAITTPAAATYATAGVGTGIVVSAGVSLTGTSASNYHLTTSLATGAIGSITPAPLTVTADNQQIIVGAALPTYTATITGFVNGENSATANLTGAPTFTTAPTTPSAVGAYRITPAAGNLAAPNYSFANFVNGSLAILSAPITAPTTAIGQTSASVAVTFPFNATATVASVGVLSNGSTDFASADSSNCVNSFAAPSSCTVDVTFTPTAPGLRSGAVVLYAAGNAPIATVYISGIGQGALLNVPSAYALHSTGSSVPAAGGFIVADAANNSYSLVNGSVIRTDASHSQTSVLTGLTGATSIALDGAGNLLAAGPAGIALVPNESGTLNPAHAALPVSTPNVTAVVVDGAGDVFYTTSDTSAITEQTTTGIVTTLGSNLLASSPLALDSAGNLYAIDQNNFIARINSGTQTEVGAAVTGITALQVDAAGDIFAASPSGILELPAATPTAAISIWTGPVSSMALDSQGDIFELDPSGSLDSFYPGLPTNIYTFPLTPIAQTLPASQTVLNQGNAPLTFSSVAVTTSNFAVDASNACSTTASIAPGAECALNFNFTPTTNGPLADTLSLASNSFTNPSSSFALAGSGALIVQTITFAPAATATYGDAPIVLSPTSTNSGIPVTLSVISGNASLTGSTLTITGIGPVVVAADQAADSTHAAAAQVQATITVNPAVLTVTADAQTRLYGAANPTLTSHFTGFVNGESAGVITGPAVLATTAVPATSVGITPITVDVSAMSATNYTFAGVSGSLTITQAPLVVTPAPATRNYGQPNPTFTGTLATVLNSDGITALYNSQAVNNTVVGAYSTGVNAIVATLSDPNNKLANYAVTNNPGTLTITAVPVTPTITGSVTKFYDGTNSANLASSFAIPGILSNDLPNAVASYTATYSQANAGTGLTVTATNIALTGSAAANYSLTSTTATGTGNINAAPVTPALTGAVTKVYDATTNASVAAANISLPGVIAADTTSVLPAAASAVYAQAGVGTGIAVTASGITLTGSAAANYTLLSASASANIGAITAASLVVTPAAATRAYGQANPTFTGTLATVLSGDGITATYASQAVATTSVGAYATGVNAIVATLSDPNNKLANYAVTNNPGTLTITAAPVTPAISGAVNKTYDGTNTANLASSLAVPGILSADLPNAVPSYTATYSQANAGTGLTVTATNIALTGSAAANYSLTSTTATGTGAINAAPVTPALTGSVTKVYNATTNATVAAANISLSGVIAADTTLVLPAAASASYAQAGIGTGIAVTASGITLSGTAAANYTLLSASASANIGAITPATLNFSGNAQTRAYGVANPVLGYTVTGMQGTDSLASAFSGNPVRTTTATTASPVGSYPITIAAGTLTSTNYTFVFAPGSLAITPAPLTPAISGAVNKTYDGTNTANLAQSFSLPGILAADLANAVPSYTATYSQANVGSGLTITASNIALAGSAAANYSLTTTTATGTGAITPAVITVPADPKSRLYGAPNPTFSSLITGFIVGQDASVITGAPVFATTATFSTPVGTAPITVDVSGMSATNYTFVGVPGTLTITPATLAFTANAATRVYGAANPVLGYSVTGFQNGDSIASAFSGNPARTTTATAASGVGNYPITIAAGTLASTNYTFTFANGTLAVTPATLTVTANNLTRVYNAANPTPTSTITGFLNGDPASVVTGAPAITIAATIASDTGTYAITPFAGSLAAANYSFTFAPGTLTITPASQTINFPAIGFTVPGSVVTLQATATSGLTPTYKVISGAASISGSQLTVLGAGSITVEADQAGNNDYIAATPATQTFSAGAPAVTLSATTVAFGSQAINSTSAAQTVVVTNSGSAALHVSTATAEAPFAASTNCSTVVAGASCSVNITFNPTASGNVTGTLTITDDASTTPQIVNLTGVGAAPGIGLSPGILTFGGQPVGTSSTPLSLTILNTGSSPLNISSVSVTLPTGLVSTDFAVAGSCSTIAAGSSCSLAVTFTPTAAGTRTAAITLADNAGSGTQLVFAAGTGTAAGVSVSPTALVFPPALVGSTSFPLTVTVTNTGTAPLTSLNGSIQGDFNVAASTCAASLAAGASCTVTLTSTPSLPGAETGTLTITDSLGTQPVALSSTGLSPGANLGASQLVFGGQLAGTISNAQTIVLTNSGTGPLAITSVIASSGFIPASNCSTSLAAGASCGINVSFTPSAAGPFNGTLTVTDSAGTQTASLAGVGTSPGLALTPSNLNFGAQQVNTLSQAQTLTLANTGTVALTLPARGATGDFIAAGDFNEADSCPASLAPGASCQLSLSFAPSALGTRSGSIAISDASGLASTLASLTGVGTLPGLSASPTSLFFGGQNVGTPSAAQTITITNTGTAALTVSAVQASGDFGQINTCTAAAINPNATCVISVTMTPTSAGARTGTLSVYDNADGLRIIALNGTGQAPGASVTPNALAFGSAPIPAPGSGISLTGTPQTVTLTNSGASPLVISDIIINGDFTENNTCGRSLAGGASCSINVGFSPTGLGHRTGVLVILDNASGGVQTITLAGDGSPTGLTLSPSAQNFGGAKVGVPTAPQIATLNNATGSAINNLAITASGEFTETDTCGTSIANGASCTISIVLTPLTESGITGTISIAGSIANSSSAAGREIRSAALRSDAVSSTSGLAVVALSGSGTPAAISLSASALTYAAQPVGSASAAQTLTITNTGSSDALTALALTATPDFPFTTTCVATLAPGASCSASVAFNPTASGARTGALTITANANSVALTAAVALSGTATGGILNVNPTTLAFGARPVGTLSAAQTITLSNSGTAALTLQPLVLAGGNFALASNTCGTTLAANASCTASITFTPSTSGAATGSVTVTSNSGSAIVGLTGSGNTQGLLLSATSFAFGNQGVGLASAAQTLTLTNQNSTAVAITSISATGDFTQTNTCGTSVAAGAACTVQLVFRPSATGASSGTVSIVNSGATQSAALSGTGTNYSAAVTGSASQSVDAGQPAVYHLSYTPGTFSGALSLACSGLPAASSCSFSPATLSLAAGAAASGVTLTITTTSRSAAAVPAPPPSSGPSPLMWTLLAGLFGTLGLLLLAAFQPRRRRSWAMSALVFGALAAAGCGGVANLPNANGGTPPGTYTVTVTATAGTATQTTNITLGVN